MVLPAGLAISGAVSLTVGYGLSLLSQFNRFVGDASIQVAGGALKKPVGADTGVRLGVAGGAGLLSAVSTIAGLVLGFIAVLFSGLGAGLLTSSAAITFGFNDPLRAGVMAGLVTSVLHSTYLAK